MIRKSISIILGCIIVALGIRFLSICQLVTGGTAGLALSCSYLTGISFAVLFFIVNLPFYLLSMIRMGKAFTTVTILCVTLLSILSAWMKHMMFPISNPWVAAIMGGGCIGIGLIVIFRSGGSLGGANILALYLQQRYNLNAGLTNFLFDCFAVLLACLAVGWNIGLYSFVAIFITGALVSQYKNPTLLRIFKFQHWLQGQPGNS